MEQVLNDVAAAAMQARDWVTEPVSAYESAVRLAGFMSMVSYAAGNHPYSIVANFLTKQFVEDAIRLKTAEIRESN